MRACRGAAKSVHARPRRRPRQQKSRKVRPLSFQLSLVSFMWSTKLRACGKILC